MLLPVKTPRRPDPIFLEAQRQAYQNWQRSLNKGVASAEPVIVEIPLRVYLRCREVAENKNQEAARICGPDATDPRDEKRKYWNRLRSLQGEWAIRRFMDFDTEYIFASEWLGKRVRSDLKIGPMTFEFKTSMQRLTPFGLNQHKKSKEDFTATGGILCWPTIKGTNYRGEELPKGIEIRGWFSKKVWMNHAYFDTSRQYPMWRLHWDFLGDMYEFKQRIRTYLNANPAIQIR